MKTTMCFLAIFVFVRSPIANAKNNNVNFEAVMQSAFSEYEKIHKALSNDSDKGVVKAAKAIEKLVSKIDLQTAPKEHSAHYKDIPTNIKTAVAKIQSAKNIAATREAFKDLSRPFVMWATMSKPKGINVVSCEMAKASWLQKEKKISNPYFGATMLRCGMIVGNKHEEGKHECGCGKHKGKECPHMKTDHQTP